MAFFNFRNVATVLLFLLISSGQDVATLAVERRDQSDTQIKPYCEQPKIQDNPQLIAHDCAVAFYNFKSEGEHKVIRRDDGSVTSTSGTCQVSLFCSSTVDITSGRMLSNSRRDGGFAKLQSTCTNNGLTGQIVLEGGCVLMTESSKK